MEGRIKPKQLWPDGHSCEASSWRPARLGRAAHHLPPPPHARTVLPAASAGRYRVFIQFQYSINDAILKVKTLEPSLKIIIIFSSIKIKMAALAHVPPHFGSRKTASTFSSLLHRECVFSHVDTLNRCQIIPAGRMTPSGLEARPSPCAVVELLTSKRTPLPRLVWRKWGQISIYFPVSSQPKMEEISGPLAHH